MAWKYPTKDQLWRQKRRKEDKEWVELTGMAAASRHAGRKTDKQGKQKKPELKKQDVRQAIIIGEVDDDSILGGVTGMPWALFPLANRALIDYSLDALLQSKIEDIFIYLVEESEALVDTHLREGGWYDRAKANQGSIRIVCTEHSSGCFMGDVMRDAYGKSLIQSHFILMDVGVVTNSDLASLLDIHKETCTKDRDAVLSVVVMKTDPTNPIRGEQDDALFGVKNGKLLFYDLMKGKEFVTIPNDVIEDDMDLHYDALDCHISVCAPVIPSIFSDNCDYESKADLIQGLFDQQELLGHTMYVQFLEGETSYAACASSLYVYDRLSQDVVKKWAEPHTPDRVLSYKSALGNVYTGTDVTTGRNVRLTRNVVVGNGCRIGSDVTLTDSVIGDDCVIGDGVTMSGSYLLPGAEVQSSSTITSSLICPRAKVLHDVTLTPGCILGHQTTVGPATTLQSGAVVMSPSAKTDDVGGLEELGVSLGAGGVGKAFECDAGEAAGLFLAGFGLPRVFPEDENDSDLESDGGDVEEDPMDDVQLFFGELLDTLTRSDEGGHGTDTIIYEINSLKHAYNIKIKEVTNMLPQAVLSLKCVEDGKMADFARAVKSIISQWKEVFTNYYRTDELMKEGLEGIKCFFDDHLDVYGALAMVLMSFYEVDALSEDVITEWYHGHPDDVNIQTKAKQIIDWFAEAEEEDDSDE